MTVAAKVLVKLAMLPEEQQRQVLQFVEELEDKTPKSALDPYGSCQDLRTDLPLEAFQANRQQLWGGATDKEL